MTRVLPLVESLSEVEKGVKKKKKALFLFPTDRQKTLKAVERGNSPDNELYGFNYFKSLGWQASFADVSPSWQNILDKVFYLLARLFRQQIDITFQLGRALLMLPRMNQADAVLTNTDSIGLPICLLKKLGFVKPPLVYAVGLFYIRGKLKQAVDADRMTWFRRFYVWILSAADHIIYHSPIEKEKLVKLGLYNPAYCSFVAMGSDANFFRKFAKSEIRNHKSDIVLSVGRDHARDYQTLFEAAKELPKIEFVVICSRRNVEGLEVPSNVKVLFDLPYSQVVDWYGKAAASVIPMKEMHRSSGQMTLTDAIQAGVPIIASDVVGIAHYGLRSGRDAMIISPENTEKLAQAIRQVMTDRLLRLQLTKASLKLSQHFTTRRYAVDIEMATSWATDPIRLRPITVKDLDFLLRLRNENRMFFFESEFVSKQDHRKWFSSYQRKMNDYMFILADGRQRIGTGAIYDVDRVSKSAEIGRFIVDATFRNKGYGKRLLAKIEEVASRELGMTILTLGVLSDNRVTKKIYEEAGFKKSGEALRNGRPIDLMKKYLISNKK